MLIDRKCAIVLNFFLQFTKKRGFLINFFRDIKDCLSKKSKFLLQLRKEELNYFL